MKNWKYRKYLKSFLTALLVLTAAVGFFVGVIALVRYAMWVLPLILAIGVFCVLWAAVHEVQEHK